MAVYFHLHSTSISVIKIKHTDLMVFCQQHVAWCFSGVFCAVRRRLRYCQPISAEISSAVVCAELAMKGYKHVSRLFNKVKLLDYLWTWRFCLIWHLIQGILSKITVLYYNPHPLLKENTSIWNSKTNQAQAHRAGGFTRQMFSVHTKPEEYKTTTITGHSGFVLEENSVREVTWFITEQHCFRKLRITETQSRRFKIYPVWIAFTKSSVFVTD